MPPRKSDAAASRKSDVGGGAAIEDSRPTATSPTSHPPTLAEIAGTAEPAGPKESQPSGSSHPPADKEKEKERRESRGNDALTIEDLNLPRSILTRLAKGVLPPNTQIQGSAMTAMSKSATVFISHLANAANNITTNAGKKTIMPADVFAALDDIEFGFLRPQLEAEYAKYNHVQTSKRSDYRKRIAAAKKASEAGGDKGAADGNDGDAADQSTLNGSGSADASFATSAADPEGTPAKPAKLSAVRDAPPQAKKAKRQHQAKGGKETGAAADDTQSDNATDGEEEEADEIQVEGEEDNGDDDEEDEDEGDEDEEDEDEDEESGEEDDALEEREDAPDDEEDEALDSDGSE